MPWGSGSGKPLWQLQTGSAEKGRAALRGTVAVPSLARLGPAATAQVPHVHYWYIESENAPKEDPVLVWTNGGPGASSMFGMLVELGPLLVNEDSFTTKDLLPSPIVCSDLHTTTKGRQNKQQVCTGAAQPTRTRSRSLPAPLACWTGSPPQPGKATLGGDRQQSLQWRTKRKYVLTCQTNKIPSHKDSRGFTLHM